MLLTGFTLKKKLALFAGNERPANKLKSTNCHQDTNYKTLDLIDLTNILCGFSLNNWTNIFTCKNILSFMCVKIRFLSVAKNVVSHYRSWNKSIFQLLNSWSVPEKFCTKPWRRIPRNAAVVRAFRVSN